MNVENVEHFTLISFGFTTRKKEKRNVWLQKDLRNLLSKSSSVRSDHQEHYGSSPKHYTYWNRFFYALNESHSLLRNTSQYKYSRLYYVLLLYIWICIFTLPHFIHLRTIRTYPAKMDIVTNLINDTIRFYKWSLTIAGKYHSLNFLY